MAPVESVTPVAYTVLLSSLSLMNAAVSSMPPYVTLASPYSSAVLVPTITTESLAEYTTSLVIAAPSPLFFFAKTGDAKNSSTNNMFTNFFNSLTPKLLNS